MTRLFPSLPRVFAAFALLLMVAAAPAVYGQDWARQRLDASPRHHEFVQVHAGPRVIETFVVYPEVKLKAPVVVLIHEIFGLSDWAREMADELAGAGYIVVAPDLLSGTGPGGGGSSAYPDQDATMAAVSKLDPGQVMGDLQAVADYGEKLPASNGKLAVVGFCWGGGKSFQFATVRADLSAAFVFYGPPPEPSAMGAIHAPVYGFYAEKDARIGATVPGTVAAMKAAGKTFAPVTYEGAGHGFMRAGEAPDASPENGKARADALARLEMLLLGLK